MNHNQYRKLCENIRFDVEDPIPGAPVDRDPNGILMDYVEELQDMALRLLEMEEELKNLHKSSEDFPYYPGMEFRVGARMLADANKFGSLTRRLSSFVENETRMTNLMQHFKEKLRR